MPRPLTQAELELRFTYHRPEGQRIEAHNDVRRDFLFFADQLNEKMRQVGPCREVSTGFTHLEEAANWFHAAIARRMPAEPIDEGEVDNADPPPPPL